MKVLIADDDDLLRDALRSFLEAAQDIEVSLAADLDSALGMMCIAGPFDITLLDYSMPGMNGFTGLAKAIDAAQDRPVALMSGYGVSELGERALAMGAAGFLPKTLPARSLLNAIRFMAAGERFLPIGKTPNAGAAGPSGASDQRLTPREQQVLRGLCEGLTNEELARNLNLSEPTVKLHVKTISRKLNARNRTHAAMLAKETGIC